MLPQLCLLLNQICLREYFALCILSLGDLQSVAKANFVDIEILVPLRVQVSSSLAMLQTLLLYFNKGK